MSVATTSPPPAWKVNEELWRCVACGASLVGTSESLECRACGKRYPIRDGVVVIKDDFTANNGVVRDYYNGPLWPKFRFWEWVTFLFQGGEKRARNMILRHLPQGSELRLLDVAIGDGVYLPWLPPQWEIVGIDISTVQLDACRRRAGERPLPLVLGEAEELPFQDRQFDAVLSIGGFNYFNDPEGSLREMARVTRPGGTIVVADEVPNLSDQMKLGRLLGFEKFD
ncbi:MAG TPA: methyltransferase domain-containing protein, partial [Isosphaeraceae bacterium]|nr:methyltransferase domain-containing protein [Isosphaeraceae bacterium]